MTFDPKHNSRTITDGPTRAPARSYYYSIGFTTEDIAKPIVGIANTLDRHHAVQLQPPPARREGGATASAQAGGTPMEFNTIAISDGITMGTEGMKTSLISPRGHRRLDRADGARLHVRRAGRASSAATRRSPAARWRSPRLNIPGVIALRRHRSSPGTFDGHDVTIQDVFEAVGAARRRQDERCRSRPTSRTPPVPAPAPAAASSPPTRWRWRMEFLGLVADGQRQRPADRPAQGRASAYDAGELVMDVLRRDLRPRDIVTRAAFENAIAGVAATGGSTNAVLHLLALAREAGVPLNIDDFDPIEPTHAAARRPASPAAATCAVDLGQGRRHPARRAAPGRGRAARHPAQSTVTGRTFGEEAALRRRDRRARTSCARSTKPLKATGGLVILQGQPRARGLRRQGRRPRAHARTAARPASSTARRTP